jgi:short subunit dehydrogenase-like uncharacterized protein
MAERDFDVVLYGAGGFTGRQTVDWFAAADETGRVALGDCRDGIGLKLEAVRDRHG